FTFTWNYAPWAKSWVLGHTWSLSVEEQFYLLWPATLLLFGPRRAAYIAVGIIVLSPAIRVGHYWLFGDSLPGIWEMLHTRADSLMFGCAAALLAESARFRRLVRGGFRVVGLLV